jgi:dephospho-CoA kinase
MPSKVYVLTGMPGAGKEEFVQVALDRGCSVVRMGDVVRSEAGKRGIEMDDRGVGGFASSEREVHGPGIWARDRKSVV